MTEGSRLSEPTQIAQMVLWLEEQRKQDKEQLGRLQQQVERLIQEAKGQVAQLSALQDELRREKTQSNRLPLLEERLQRCEEWAAALQERFEQRVRDQDHIALLRQTELERDRKYMKELAQQINDLSRLHETLSTKITLLIEDVKHEHSTVEPMLSLVESLQKETAQLVERLQGLDERRKRLESQVVALQSSVDDVLAEQPRLVERLQAIESRLARQLSEWRSQMENWQKQDEEQALKFLQFGKQLTQISAENLDLFKSLAEQHKRSEDHGQNLQQLQKMLDLIQQTLAKTAGEVDNQGQRLDVQSAMLRQFEEQWGRSRQDLRSLEQRLEQEQVQIERQGNLVKRLEDELRAQLGEFEQEFKQKVTEISEGAELSRREMQGYWERVNKQLADIERVQEQYKQQRITELEQYILELKEGRASPQE
ncbi:MAG: hypothetical protein M1136_06745 [Chloroflexi bacterium]|nr:hypothetical protein [Chloroflexota bacterium]MCL5075330.1 hypothetical protein [Chloroflexota bacterium]